MATKQGAIPLARRYLAELVDAQEEYRREHGRYAVDAHQLKFFVRRALLPLGITVTPTGWTASISQARGICRITASRRGNVDGPACVDPQGNPLAENTAADRAQTRATLRASPIPIRIAGPNR